MGGKEGRVARRASSREGRSCSYGEKGAQMMGSCNRWVV